MGHAYMHARCKPAGVATLPVLCIANAGAKQRGGQGTFDPCSHRCSMLTQHNLICSDSISLADATKHRTGQGTCRLLEEACKRKKTPLAWHVQAVAASSATAPDDTAGNDSSWPACLSAHHRQLSQQAHSKTVQMCIYIHACVTYVARQSTPCGWIAQPQTPLSPTLTRLLAACDSTVLSLINPPHAMDSAGALAD